MTIDPSYGLILGYFRLLMVASNIICQPHSDWMQHADWTLWLHLFEWPGHADASGQVASPVADGLRVELVAWRNTVHCQIAVRGREKKHDNDRRLAQEFRMPKIS